MKLRALHEVVTLNDAIDPVEIVYFNPYEHEWEAADQADQIAKDSGIRPNSKKELKIIALSGGRVIGAIWSSLEQERDSGDWIYDLDVAVDPKSRGQGLASALVGPKLIDAALSDYRNTAATMDGYVYIRTQVVNSRLAHWLENNRDFSPESRRGWSPDAQYMTYGM